MIALLHASFPFPPIALRFERQEMNPLIVPFFAGFLGTLRERSVFVIKSGTRDLIPWPVPLVLRMLPRG
jgi:hypothetical protein